MRELHAEQKRVFSKKFKLNGDKSQAQICEEYSIYLSIFFRWLKTYKELRYDDSVFSVSRGMPESIISDY